MEYQVDPPLDDPELEPDVRTDPVAIHPDDPEPIAEDDPSVDHESTERE